MTAMTATSAPVGAWTLVYTAGSDISVVIANTSPATKLLVRVGSAAVVGDALTAPAISLHCEADRTLALKNGDKVFVRPAAGSVLSGSLVVWA